MCIESARLTRSVLSSCCVQPAFNITQLVYHQSNLLPACLLALWTHLINRRSITLYSLVVLLFSRYSVQENNSLQLSVLLATVLYTVYTSQLLENKHFNTENKEIRHTLFFLSAIITSVIVMTFAFISLYSCTSLSDNYVRQCLQFTCISAQ